MIKNALSKNKPAFILLFIGLCMFFLDFLTWFIYYGTHQYSPPTFNSFYITIAVGCLLLMGEMVRESKNNDKSAIIPILIVFALIFFAFFSFFSNISIISYLSDNPYIDNSPYVVNIFVDLFYIGALVLLFLSLLKKKLVFSIVSIALAGTAIFFSLVAQAMNMGDYFEAVQVFDMLFSLAMSVLFFLGFFFFSKSRCIATEKKKAPALSQTEELLLALKVKLELGSITEEEYNAKKQEIINNL